MAKPTKGSAVRLTERNDSGLLSHPPASMAAKVLSPIRAAADEIERGGIRRDLGLPGGFGPSIRRNESW